MDRKIRVGAVSYLNTKPLIYGFENGMMQDEMELLIDYPSNIASALLNNRIDIGLVPIAILPRIKDPFFITDYGIACDGPVASVCLFSNVPIEAVDTVLLDYQSHTSVQLLKLLLKDYWKINPAFENTSEGYIGKIEDKKAALIIGDRAFEQRLVSPYIYDLGEAWKNMTGLPFVFAAWVSNKPISPDFIDHFTKANQFGIENIDRLLKEQPYTLFDLKKYYSSNIHFNIDEQKKAGLNKFFELTMHIKMPVLQGS